MNQERKEPKREEQAAAHPETQNAPQKLPDDRASKVSSPKRDARTGHDKDGNAEQPGAGRKAG
jgi:hypothetical protein